MPRYRLIHLAETGSTNKDAMRLALAGEELPLWVTADRQTAGKGRAGRHWVSISGNLHASVAFRTQTPPERIGQIALVAGLMLYDAVAATTELAQMGRVRLKWPNDLLADGAKLGGILVESTLCPGPGDAVVVIGFGLNVAAAPENTGRAVASLAQLGTAVSAELIVAALARKYARWITAFADGRGFSGIRSEWLDRAGPVGEQIAVNTGSGVFSGTYQGLGETGALLAEVEGKLVSFTFGDVAAGSGAAT